MITIFLIFWNQDDDKIRTTPPITLKYLWTNRTAEKVFDISHINTDGYLREVRRALFTHMFSNQRVDDGRYLAFCARYRREGGIHNKVTAQPKFDAWCLVRGCSRNIFNYKRFFARYPSCYEQIKRLRGLLGIIVDDRFLWKFLLFLVWLNVLCSVF